jgi:hypothetical protein
MSIIFESITKANIPVFLDFIKKPNIKRHMFAITGINYVELYCYFKALFGSPNGMQSLLRKQSSDNLFHWDYCLQKDSTYFDFAYSYRQIELLIVSENEILDFDIVVFINSIKESIKKNSDSIKQQKEQLELWDLFQNTYARIRKTQDYFYENYTKNLPKEIEVRHEVIYSSQYLEKHFKKTKDYILKLNIAKNYGIALRMLYPVVGEAFINLVMYVLAKPEVKNDKRTFETISRNNIDVRIKTLHLYCNGIKNVYDQNDERFKDFLRLMDKRNDFLHGNITPGFNTFDQVYFDGTVPIFPEPRDLNKEFSSQVMFQITKNEMDSDLSTINKLTDYILENLEDKEKEDIIMIISARELGWNKKKNKIGILFPPYIVESYPGGDK